MILITMNGLLITLAIKRRDDIPARFLMVFFQLQLLFIKNALRARVHFCINLTEKGIQK